MKNSQQPLRSYLYKYKRSITKKMRKAIRVPQVEMALLLTSRREKTALIKARENSNHSQKEFNNPLVTVTIATYNRGALLVERTIPSVFAQTYSNFEIIIVGDCCSDNTKDLIEALNDPRIKFSNLAQRGPYPTNKKHFHCVAGIYPMNSAYDQANGLWLAHLDDDEVWAPNHLEVSLNYAYQHNLEFISSNTLCELSPGNWELMKSCSLSDKKGRGIHHSSVIFRDYLKLFRLDINSWRLGLGADWHQFARMAYAGVKSGVVNEVTVHCPLRPGNTRPWEHAEDLDLLLGN